MIDEQKDDKHSVSPNSGNTNVSGIPILSNRPVKFRCWDGQNMWLPDTLSNDGNKTRFAFYNDKKSIGWGLYDNKLDNRIVTGDANAIFNTPGTLMQFTGDVDKNGNEIYEGDFLKCKFVNYDYDEIDNPNVPRWIERFSYVERNGRGWWVKGEGFGWEGEDLWNWEQSEIVGNVFQNPELLGCLS